MASPMQSLPAPPGDMLELRRCVRDLIALSALSAVWIRKAPRYIGQDLADVLLRTLELDVACVSLKASPSEDAFDVVRLHESLSTSEMQIREAVKPCLAAGRMDQRIGIADPGGKGTIQMTILPIGPDQAYGCVSVGSRHMDFPNSSERLLLGVAVNQAALSLQNLSLMAALRDSETKFRTAFRHASLGVAIVTPAGRFVETNPAYSQILGYSSEELRQRDLFSLAHPDEAGGIRHALEEMLAGEAPGYVKQSRYIHREGRVVLVQASVSVVRDAQGLPGNIILLMEDVTARIKADQDRQMLIGVIENSPDFIAIATPDQRTFFVNGAGQRMVGLDDPQEVQATSLLDFFPEEERESISRTAIPALLKNGAWDGEVSFRNFKSGELMPMLWNAFTIADPSTGETTALGCVSRNISERKRIETQLQEMSRLKSLGLLAGGIAHDFNNLLTAILGNASLVCESLPVNDRKRELLDEVIRAGERAADLTSQMLAYAGKGRYVVQQINVSEFIRQNQTLFDASMPKAIELQLELAADLPAVEADPIQLQQVMMNLLVNAREAIGEQVGVVRLTSGVQYIDEHAARVTFGGEPMKPGAYVYFEVQDTGCGMAADVRARIFEPFFSTKFTGRGLGLAAVSGIIRSHKGAIQVHSSLHKGSTFKIFLPAVPPAVAEQGPAQTAPAAKTELRGQGTILIVDDEPVVRNSARAALTHYGYTVVEAENGKIALEQIDRSPHRISAVLLDLTMPVMNGEETVKFLRVRHRNIPVILSSGYAEDDATRRFAGAGLAGFIQKPYTAAQLAQKIKSVCK